MSISRRGFILQSAALALALPGCRTASDSPLTERQKIFLADAEPLYSGPAPAAESFIRDPLAAFALHKPRPKTEWLKVRPQPKPWWPDRPQSIDYRHISEICQQPGAEPFAINGRVLTNLAQKNSFDLTASKDLILFGLRGCIPVEAEVTDFAREVMAVEAIPDHLHLRCLMGIWRRVDDSVWITRASTVPNVEYMFAALDGRPRCNLLPTGLHRYAVGTHAQDSDYPQLGALRQVDPVPVLRSSNNLCFELPPRDAFDTRVNLVVHDNIHAGRFDREAFAPYFSSAGCQVIPGGYTSVVSTYGPWSVFRKLAGLKPLSVSRIANELRTTDDGKTFQYMLLTGAEARTVSQGNSDLIGARIRFGSSGVNVARLHERLGMVQQRPQFNHTSMNKLFAWQIETLGFADGIIEVP